MTCFVGDDHQLFEGDLPKALKETWPDSIIVSVDGRTINSLRDILRAILSQMASRLDISMDLPEDIGEFYNKTAARDALPCTFILINDASFVSHPVFMSTLMVLKGRLSGRNVNFVMDGDKPTIDLPFYQQDRLLHFNVSMPKTSILVDELVHRLLRRGHGGLLFEDASLCKWLMDMIYERCATLNNVCRWLSYAKMYSASGSQIGDNYDNYRNIILKLYTCHFALVRLLKQDRQLLDTLTIVLDENFVNLPIFTSICDAFKKASIVDRLSVFGDVKRAISENDHKLQSLLDNLIVNVNDYDNVDRLLSLLSSSSNMHINKSRASIIHNLQKAFQPDIHLALQTALRHPHLYTNTCLTATHPVCQLYRVMSETVSLQMPTARLHKHHHDKATFYTCLRHLQMTGQIGVARRRDHVDRLNVDEQAELPEPMLDLLFT